MRLAQFRDFRCKHNEEEIAKSPQGHYLEEHVFALRQAVEFYDVYNAQIAACDDEIQKLYERLQNEYQEQLPPIQTAVSE